MSVTLSSARLPPPPGTGSSICHSPAATRFIGAPQNRQTLWSVPSLCSRARLRDRLWLHPSASIGSSVRAARTLTGRFERSSRRRLPPSIRR
jgi:hypothetical protein